jgi:hypothetical protein
MNRVALLVIVASCWRGGGPEVVAIPPMVIKAERPPPRDGCLAALDELWEAQSAPAVGEPVMNYQCGDNDDYWWCMFNEQSRTLQTLSNAAYWAVYYCQPEQ